MPAGTWVTIRINQALSSDRNQPGDAFTGTLVKPIVINGLVVARRGETVGGRVSEAVKAGYVKGTSRLGVEVTELTLADGRQVVVNSQLVERQGPTSVGNDAAAIGMTTGAGAAIGAAAAGGFGAGMGAIAGAGASIIGVLVTRGHASVIYPESVLTFRLQRAVTIDGNLEAFTPVTQEDYDQPRMQQRQGYGRPGPGYGAPPPPAPYGYPSPYAYAPYPYYGFGYGFSPGFWGPSFFYFSGPRYYGGFRGYRGYGGFHGGGYYRRR